MTKFQSSIPANQNGQTIRSSTGANDNPIPGSSNNWGSLWNSTTAVAVAPSLGSCLKTTLGFTVALYILNQKHLLPRPLSALVSKTLFWPTLPITVSRRLGNWETKIDETVVLGGAPFGFAKLPDKLYEEYGIRGVINLCEEYAGPDEQYKRLGIRHLRLPTTDHFEPTVQDLEAAVDFISELEHSGDKVYVHCRAGHGRSAAVVFAWLMSKNPHTDLQKLNAELCLQRNVRKTLWKQKNIIEYQSRLQNASQQGDVKKEL